MIMRLVLFALVVVFSFSIVEAQESTKELTRKERRAIEREKKEKEKALINKHLTILTKNAIDSSSWVLEADRLFGRRGGSVNVPSNINFIAIEGENAFVQLGSNSGLGANGVGGVSVRGKVSKYEVDYNEKKESYYIVVMVTSALGSFDIRMNCNGTGEMVDATVKGNSASSVRYSGVLVPVQHSKVYKGTPII
ncbi:DUF4251 domain-containing protein [Labilibacter sediminis]|nr:DUF4251 domain-containing protein [Labilibacter sediminis]